ncbi:hypothetical protein NFI95_02535 [Acetobacteraceae bacterium KSS8]|uniref:Tetratricopeptide repeat protein n=1 Tax=Endosaccharibacter trunci TaxID=2812733 RepID=A0ABT1W389_9PROT|nr:hypothetical protein [Acetobacteraceae bacterium KSS8]
MRLHRSALLGATVLAGFAAAGALACGPFFPWQLLNDRVATLHDLPVDSFFFQASHLLPPPDPALEKEQAAAPDGAVCSTYRESDDSGGEPSAAAELYATGARAFDGGDGAGATQAFRAVLQGGGRGVHAVCAAFMLGRALDRSGDTAGAEKAFLRTRDLVSHGAPDPFGLAVASFGEQARLFLRQSGLVAGPAAAPQPAPPTPEALAALHKAVTLYSQQAAYRDENGVDSLQEVAEAMLSEQPGAQIWFDAAAKDPRIRQLLLAYAVADTPLLEGIDEDAAHSLLGSLDSKPVSTRVLDQLAPVFDPAEDSRDAGRLAAVAYLAGRYDLAAQFATAPADPLSAWIRAKLSLQHDDLAESARRFAEAVQVLAAHPDALGETGTRLRAETGVMDLARGDFVPALTVLFGFGDTYWGDTAYVAERLVTTDQLRSFVKTLPPLPPKPAVGDRGASIRNLLARRLMREGAYAEAAGWFTDPALAADSRRFASLDARSRDAFWRTDRAEASWKAAVLERQKGMELFGTEVLPDQAVTEGDYPDGYGPSKPPSGPLVTPLEKRRFAANAPDPDRRFHYRFDAAREAERSAGMLPPRSQAFYAVLCGGASWLLETDDQQGASQLYKAYVAKGALQPKGAVFGETCPAPDFAAAAHQRWWQPLDAIERGAARHWRGLRRRLGV